MLKVRIVCLANSRKLGGRCVAGKEVAQDGAIGGWVRPISDRQHEELSEYERQYANGADPELLDVIDVPMRGPRPRQHQTENWLVDPDRYWRRVGQADWAMLRRAVDPVDALWVDGNSSGRGVNDRISCEDAVRLTSSLRLVHVDQLRISVLTPGADFGNMKRQVRGYFRNGAAVYNLGITDPIYELRYRGMPNGTYEIGECILTISIGEPYQDGNCYKLIAGVVEHRE